MTASGKKDGTGTILDFSAAYEALRSSEKQLRTFISLAPLSIAMFDRDMRYLATSRRWLEDYGRGYTDVIGRTHYEIHPDIPERWKRIHQRGLAGEELKNDEDLWIQADGTRHWLRWSITPWRSEGDEVAGIIIATENITGRKRMEEELRASERRLIAAQRVGRIGSWEWNLTTGEINGSQEFYRLLDSDCPPQGPDALAVLERSIHPEDRYWFRTIIEGKLRGHNASREIRVVMPDGSIRWLVSQTETNDGDAGPSTRILGILSDITERKKSESEREALEERLLQAHKMEAIGQLTAGIAHDFNNILASVLGYSELVLNQSDVLPDSKVSHFAREIITAGSRGRDLVQQMLAFSRVGKISHVPVRLGAIATEISRTLAPTLPASLIFSTRVSTERDVVIGDPVQLHQVILNLVINSRDAVGEHGHIEVAVRDAKNVESVCAGCRLDFAGDFIELAVVDDGMGIPHDRLSRIFDPFYTGKRQGQGTGLGLSVVHGIVHDLGGHIIVESRSGLGTAMRVLLPMARTQSEVKNSAPEIVADEKISMTGGGRVLIVDDEELLARMFGEMIHAHGFETEVFFNSREALARFAAAPGEFDAVVSDQTMPEHTGIELTRAVRKMRPDIPIILCSGYSALLNESVAEKLGVSFLPKPISFKVLLPLLKRLIDAASSKSGTDAESEH